MTAPLYVSLGFVLASLRPPRSQQAVADQLGISRTTLSHAENGYVLLNGPTLAGLLYLYQPDEAQRRAVVDALIECGAPHAL